MKHRKWCVAITSIVAIVAIAAMLGGCVAMGPDLVRSGQVRVSHGADDSWRILHAKVRDTGETWRVSGRVSGRRSSTLRPRGHLDVVMMSSDGSYVASTTAKLLPNRGFRRRFRTASFAATLPRQQDGVEVRINYHVGEHEDRE